MEIQPKFQRAADLYKSLEAVEISLSHERKRTHGTYLRHNSMRFDLLCIYHMDRLYVVEFQLRAPLTSSALQASVSQCQSVYKNGSNGMMNWSRTLTLQKSQQTQASPSATLEQVLETVPENDPLSKSDGKRPSWSSTSGLSQTRRSASYS